MKFLSFSGFTVLRNFFTADYVILHQIFRPTIIELHVSYYYQIF